MRKQRKLAPRLEVMEDRVVPSIYTANIPPSIRSDFHQVGAHVSSYYNSVKNYFTSLVNHPSGQTHQAWPTAHKAPSTSHAFLGIPWLKF